MSRANKWVPIDKYLVQELTKINRPFSKIEAMYSFTLDQDNERGWSVNGYAKLWQWSRNKVREFTNSIRTDCGHIKDTTRTHYGHPIHFIDKGLWTIKDTLGTDCGHIKDTLKDTTTNPNPNPNKKDLSEYSEKFETFWKEYPNKKGKFKAFTSWKKYNCDNSIFDSIMESLESHKQSKEWLKDNGDYIPHGSTWVHGRGWEDEIKTVDEWS